MDTIAYLVAFAINMSLDSQGLPTRINTLDANGSNNYQIQVSGETGLRHIKVTASEDGVATVAVTGPKGGKLGTYKVALGENPVPNLTRVVVSAA